MPLSERYTHWLQAPDEEVLGYDLAHEGPVFLEELAAIYERVWDRQEAGGSWMEDR
jgi:hypothetical protein